MLVRRVNPSGLYHPGCYRISFLQPILRMVGRILDRAGPALQFAEVT